MILNEAQAYWNNSGLLSWGPSKRWQYTETWQSGWAPLQQFIIVTVFEFDWVKKYNMSLCNKQQWPVFIESLEQNNKGNTCIVTQCVNLNENSWCNLTYALLLCIHNTKRSSTLSSQQWHSLHYSTVCCISRLQCAVFVAQSQQLCHLKFESKMQLPKSFYYTVYTKSSAWGYYLVKVCNLMIKQVYKTLNTVAYEVEKPEKMRPEKHRNA